MPINKLKHSLFIIYISFLHLSLEAQSRKIDLSVTVQSKMDSLQNQLQTAKQDTTRLRLYLALGNECDVKDNLKYAPAALQIVEKLLPLTSDTASRNKLLRQQVLAFDCLTYYYEDNAGRNPEKELKYREKTLAIFERMGDKEGMKNSQVGIADYYFRKGDIFKQLEILKKGLAWAEKENYKGGQSRFVNQIKNLYVFQGDTAQAMNYFDRAVELEKEIGDTNRIAKAYYLTGIFYFDMGKLDKAIINFESAIQEFIKRKDTAMVAASFLDMGKAYSKRKDFTKALDCFQKASSFGEKAGDMRTFFLAMIAVGEVYLNRDEFDEAIAIHKKCLSMVEPYSDDTGISMICFALAKDYYKKKDFVNAKKYAERSLFLSRRSGAFIDIMYRENRAYKIDSASGNGKDAFTHYQQYILLRDKFNSDEVKKAASREKFQSDYDKQKASDKADQERKDALSLEEKEKQKVIIYAVSAGLVLVLLLMVFVFRGYRQKQKANYIISQQKAEVEHAMIVVEEKQKEILDSISYAQRIQNALLPPMEEVFTALPQSFILFKPKDIVAGDFYWFSVVGNKKIIAACDCTGHGVPGAFMSTIGSEKLNEAVKDTSDVSIILNLVNRGMKKVLRQTDNIDSTRDGMDVVLCAFNESFTQVEYAGANRPLWIIRKDATEIEEIKATKVAIGGLTEDNQVFEKHIINLQKGDTVYLFSDGYADQFSPNDKKLMTRKLKEIILSIQTKSMDEQHVFLDEFIENWRGDLEQTDDILVIGVRV